MKTKAAGWQDPDHNTILILRALLDGREVRLGDRTHALSDDNDLVVKGMKYTTDSSHGLPVWLRTNITLQEFLGMCAKATEDEVVTIAADAALSSPRDV